MSLNWIELVSGLVVSVLGGVIAYAITASPKVSLAAFLGMLAGALGILASYRWFRAPYELTDVQWQIRSEGIQVTGLLVERNTDKPVERKPVQIKIFEAGQDAPFKGPSYPTTDASGRFIVTFDARGLKQDTLYVINTAYKFDDTWEIRDFEVASGGPGATPPKGALPMISIYDPQEGKEVDARNWVRGRVSDPVYEVYVLVHPLQADSWWVQPVPKVAPDGSWESFCFFGEGLVGSGESFEILAIASPTRGLLRRGQQLQLGEVTADVAKSTVIRVRRR